MEKFPKKLYRFRSSSSEYFEDELKQLVRGKIYQSTADMQNDPFDTSPYFEKQKIIEIKKYLVDFHKKFGKIAATGLDVRQEGERLGLTKKAAKKHSKSFTEASIDASKHYQNSINKYVDRICHRTCSAFFTTNIESVLMWSHYANSHKGICIEFDLRLDINNTIEAFLMPMNYSSTRPKVTTVEGLKLCLSGDNDKDTSYLGDEVWEIIQKVFTYKAKEWQYEEEWRMFNFGSKKAGYYTISPLEVSRILIGANAPEKVKELVKSYFPEKYVETKLSQTQYKIEVCS